MDDLKFVTVEKSEDHHGTHAGCENFTKNFKSDWYIGYALIHILRLISRMQAENESTTTNDLFSVFGELFDINVIADNDDQEKNIDIDNETKLYSTKALNYSLNTSLSLNDDKWVLIMLNINNLKQLNKDLGYESTNMKIKFLGTIIYDFCERNPFRFRGFRYNKDGKGDIFAILIYCKKQLSFAETQIKLLNKKINNELGGITVSIGIAKMIKTDTFKKWIKRCLNNITNAKLIKNSNNEYIYSDININLNNNNINIIHKNDNSAASITDITNKEKEILLGDKKDIKKYLKDIVINFNFYTK